MNFQVDSEKMQTAVTISDSCESQSEIVFSDASSLASLPLPERFSGDPGLLSRIKSSASELKSLLAGLKSNCNNLYDLAVEAEQVGNPDSSTYKDMYDYLVSQQEKSNSIIEIFEKESLNIKVIIELKRV